ncbi:hypothetical protein [Nonomuraea sp. NPDC003201]
MVSPSRPTSSSSSIAGRDRPAEVHRGERDLRSALTEYQADLLERGNAAVEHGKEAMKRFVPADSQSSR